MGRWALSSCTAAVLALALGLSPCLAQVPPPAPTLHFPYDGLQVLNPDLQFMWSSSPTAESVAWFQFQAAQDRNFGRLALDVVFFLDARPSGVYKMTPPPAAFENLARYYWRVRTRDRAGLWGAYSEAWKFDTFFAPPEIFPTEKPPGPEPSVRRPFGAEYSFEPYSKSVQGDESRSFVPSGVFSVHKLGLTLQQNVRGLELSSRLDFQHTDDPQLLQDKRKTQFLGGSVSVEKAEVFRLQAGDTSADLSRSVFNSSLRGLSGHVQRKAGGAQTRLALAAGEALPAKEGAQFQRLAAGGKIVQGLTLGRTSLEVGFALAHGEDRLGSVARSSGLSRLKTDAYGLSLKLSHAGASAELEAARSKGTEEGGRGAFDGTSLRFSPRLQAGVLSLSGNAERGSPDFFNPLGGGPADTLRLDGTLAASFEPASLSLSYGTNRNNVDRQKPETSRNENYGVNASLSPFKQRGGPLAGLSLSAAASHADSFVTGGRMRTRDRSLRLGPGFSAGNLSLSANAGWSAFEDLKDRANDRKGLNASGNLGYRLKLAEAASLDPALSLGWSETERLATGALNNTQNASLSLGGSLGKTTLSASQSLEWLRDGFTGRRSTQNRLQLSLQHDLEPGAPGSLNLSYSRSAFRDSQRPKTIEIELRGGLNLKI